ncbi:MAG: hypothetical protein JNL60_07415 [Bacteroidia bacterium]|nr:hypothetical protein [Bacteroidia bacterium]
MKKFLIFASLSGILFSSCKTSQAGYSTDDAYVSPAEEKKKAELARAEEARKEAEERQRREEAVAAQKAKDDANPYYKDPTYNSDDYYDYEYSARLNRFYNPIGVGYYDGYYTNMYTYNQIPSYYGTSIYTNYGYNSGWNTMPSTQFNNWSVGVSTGWGYGCNSYNSMSYYSGYGNYGSYYNYPYYGYSNYWGYDPYTAGYMNGFNNGLYSAAYYNIYDPYSGYQQTYAPRTSGVGTSAAHNRQSESISADNSRRTYVESVQQQQANSPRFSSAYQNSARSGYQQNNTSSQQGVYRNRVEQNRVESGQQGSGQNGASNGRVRYQNSERQYQNQDNNNSRQQNRGTSTWENNSGGSNNSGNSGGSSSPRNGGGDSGARRRSR